MKKLLLMKTVLLLFALVVGSGSVWATDAASFSRSGTTNTTTGGTFSSSFSAKTGYYQDNTGTCYMQILSNSAYWTTTPSSITLTSTIGGGSGNKDLSSDVYAVLLDSNGDEISSTATSITSHITTAGGDTYNTSIPVANNVYGIKIYHEKESGYNVRYYSFTLSYEAGSTGPINYSVTYDGNGATSGTAPEDDNEYESGDEVTVLGNTGSLAKEHNTFGGWNTQNDGEGTNYAAGDKFNITANTTLYAKWIVNTNSVTLPTTDEFGEYSMNKSNPVAYNTEVTLTYTPAKGYENYIATWSVNGEKISGNKFNMPDADVTVTVSLNEVFDMTLTNSDIVSAGSAATGYGSKTITDSNGKTWNAYAIKNQHSNATSSYHFLQIRAYDSSAKTAYYIQIPEYGRKITKLEMTVSSSGQPMTGGGNSATLFFSASNSTSATGTGVASGTGAKTVTIDCSSLNLNTGYITASAAVRIWDVKVTYDPIRLNGSGYATYAGLTPINYSDGSKFTAWAITKISDDAITFSKITGSVPAGTGVLLMGTAGQAVEPVVAASGTEITNKLVGITTATAVAPDTYYGLSGNQFKKVGAGTVPAGRALLPANEVPASARELNFVFDEATGIKQVETSKSIIEGIYNLAGQKVQNPTKGLYIMNGKKVIIK